MAMSAVLTGDDGEAREQYNPLLLHRGTLFHQINMSADRLLGLLCQAMGNHDQAAVHFEEALDFCRRAGYRPELAWSSHDYGDLLFQRNASGDQARTRSLLDEALAISSELGMRPLMERVLTLQERAVSQLTKTPEYPDRLTQREVEVLRLIAAGKTDREIAEELVISVKTVGNHVSNILNKTSTANRTEAATYAAQRGLL